MRKIVHIFPIEKFTIDFIKNTNKLFDDSIFLLYGNSTFLIEYNNCFKFETLLELLNFSKENGILESANKIIIHSFFNGYRFKEVLSFYGDKVFIVFWGGDIYSIYRDWFHLSPIETCISLAKRFLHTIYTRKARGIITMMKYDSDFLSKKIKYSGERHICHYISSSINDDYYLKMDKNIEIKKETNPAYILVGNSASQNNRHIEVIDYISKYKDENVIFVFPLSYGDKKYAEKVIKYGKNKLGKCFLPLTDFLKYDEYFKILQKCSCGIFNNDRQQALANINDMLTLGAKVYLNGKSPLWEYYNTNGYIVHSTKEIEKMKFADFVSYSISDKHMNYQLIKNFRNMNNFYNSWKLVYDE